MVDLSSIFKLVSVSFFLFLGCWLFLKMQSIIQYKRFKKAVQAQLERDKEKADRHHRPEQTVADQSPSSSTSDERKTDLEKGDVDNEQTRSVANAPIVRPEDLDRQIDEPSIPKEEANAVEENHNPENFERRDFQEPVEENKPEDLGEGLEDEDEEDFELRANSRTLSRTTTQQSGGTALGNVLTGIEIRKRTTTEGGDGNVFIVSYESPEDPNDPHNWSNFTRIRCTITIAAIGFVVGFASAVDSSVIPQAAKDFGVSEVVESMATGLFLIGFGVGALIAVSPLQTPVVQYRKHFRDTEHGTEHSLGTIQRDIRTQPCLYRYFSVIHDIYHGVRACTEYRIAAGVQIYRRCLRLYAINLCWRQYQRSMEPTGAGLHVSGLCKCSIHGSASGTSCWRFCFSVRFEAWVS